MLSAGKLAPLFFLCVLFAGLAESAEKKCTQSACVCNVADKSAAQVVDCNQFWRLHHSAHFTVCCPQSFDGSRALRQCESLRQTLSKKWLGTAGAAWQSRCYVVFHPTAASYIQAVGRGSEQTLGCSSVKELGGRVLSRRIDLRLDRTDPLAGALPHELTHIVLADVVAINKLPRWADEGMAMLADPLEKQEAHRRDLIAALNRGRAVRLAALLALDGYPQSPQMPAFYGQSLSLVEFLVERKGPLELQVFLQKAAKEGYLTALHETYGIRDLRHLERLWLASVEARDGSTSLAKVGYRSTERSSAAMLLSP